MTLPATADAAAPPNVARPQTTGPQTTGPQTTGPQATGWWRAVRAPAAVAGTACAAVAMVGLRDPHAAGNYPTCPSIALFGVHCPGCGSMRAMHEFAHGDIVGMFSRNILVPLGAVLLAWAWVAWVDRRLGRHRVPPLRPPVPVLYGSVVVLIAFAVLRNLPYAPFSGLAP